MIPLVGDNKELKYVKKAVVETADAEIAASGVDLKYEVGTMIEIPRAALTADEIAKEADFFCFGTNDLTQMTYGFSRDDAGKFLNAYYDAKIFENDPFAKLDHAFCKEFNCPIRFCFSFSVGIPRNCPFTDCIHAARNSRLG